MRLGDLFDMKLSKKHFFEISRPSCEFVAAFCLFFSNILTIFNGITRFFLNTYKIDTIIVYGILVVLFLSISKELLHKIKFGQILFVFTVFFVLLFSMLLSSQPSVNLEVIIQVLSLCVVPFFGCCLVRDFNQFKKYIVLFATIVPYFLVFVYFVLGNGSLGKEGTYDQGLTYSYLISAIILCGSLFEKVNIKKLIPFLLCLFSMLSFGARGPIVCVAIYFIVRLTVLLLNKQPLKAILILLVYILGFLIIYINLETIIQFTIQRFDEMGFSTRVLSRILDNSLLEDKARKQIYIYCIDYIKSNPNGVGGPVNDRIYLSKVLYGWNDVLGCYPHNFFLEIIMQFGLLFGVIILIVFILFVIKAYKNNKTSENVLLMFLGFGFIPLLFSGSYVSFAPFWMLIALCSVTIKKHKENNIIRNYL